MLLRLLSLTFLDLLICSFSFYLSFSLPLLRLAENHNQTRTHRAARTTHWASLCTGSWWTRRATILVRASGWCITYPAGRPSPPAYTATRSPSSSSRASWSSTRGASQWSSTVASTSSCANSSKSTSSAIP